MLIFKRKVDMERCKATLKYSIYKPKLETNKLVYRLKLSYWQNLGIPKKIFFHFFLHHHHHLSPLLY